ncbi:MAG: MmgE/PrpD family protein [Nocardioidaceae bacterium]|nr:MmgE/PrpD family protein [Nocardioidaceae bacterium]
MPVFVHELRFADLPTHVVEQGQRCVLDLLGVGAVGAGTQLSRLACEHAARHFGAVGTGARMLFDGRRVSPVGAALAGGMTIDSLDGHEGHSLAKGHVGAALLPALLALADGDVGLDGPELLTGLVGGYEVGIRAGMTLHATAAEYHVSGAWNALACAAAAARLLRLSLPTTNHALGIAEYHGPRGPMMRCIDHPTMVKDGSGWGAMTGVSAALLAADGFTGAPAMLVYDERPHIAALWQDLGVRWRILELYFKPHPVCRWAQPAVQAALELRKRHQLVATQVDHAEVVTFHHAARLSTRRPRTTEEAQYSLPFPVAAALARGVVGPAEVGPGGLTDEQVLRLSDGITMIERHEYTSKFPAERWAEVTVVLRDGRRISSGPTTATGDPDHPLTDAALDDKFHSLVDGRLGRQRSAAIATAVRRLTDPAADLEQLFELIFRPSTSPTTTARARPAPERIFGADGMT